MTVPADRAAFGPDTFVQPLGPPPPLAVDAGRVVERTLGPLRRHPLTLMALSSLFAGVPAAADALWRGFGVVDGPLSGWRYEVAYWLIITLFMAMLQGGLGRATLDDLSGRPVAFRRSLAEGVRLALPLFAISLASTLGTGIGFVLLIVPGVYLLCHWIVATPALIAEGESMRGALERSGRLTEDRKLVVFGLILAGLAPQVGLVLAEEFVRDLVVNVAGEAWPHVPTVLAVAGAFVIATLNGALVGVGVAALYVELRHGGAPLAAATTASVFD